MFNRWASKAINKMATIKEFISYSKSDKLTELENHAFVKYSFYKIHSIYTVIPQLYLHRSIIRKLQLRI